MIGGVSFQPQDQKAQGQQGPRSPQGAVQEAIQVLSLRLPKVVGARAVSPGALLNAQGSGGDSRIDGVVNSILQRLFPTGSAPQGQAPMVPQMAGPAGSAGAAPNVWNDLSQLGGQRQPDWWSQIGLNAPPRIVVGGGNTGDGPPGPAPRPPSQTDSPTPPPSMIGGPPPQIPKPMPIEQIFGFDPPSQEDYRI